MAATTALWMVLCLAGPAASVGAPDTAPAPCSGRGSVRGHAENQTRCSVDGRLYRHAPAALLTGWRQLVTLGTVHQMRSRLHHLARHKRSAPEDPGSGGNGVQQPCCPSQTSVMIPLSAVSSDSGMRVPLAQAPPSHVQPVLVVSCDGDRCPHTNSTCKQMYAPQMLVRLSGRRLILDLVNIESGCQCVPPLPQLPTDDVTTTISDDVTKPPGASARLPGVTTGAPTAGPGTVAHTGTQGEMTNEQMTTPEMRTTSERAVTKGFTAEAPTTAATTEPATMTEPATEMLTMMTEAPTTEATATKNATMTTDAATMTTMAVTMKARTTGVHSDRTELPNNRPTLMSGDQVTNVTSTSSPPAASTATAGTTMARTTMAETTMAETTMAETTVAETTMAETTTAGATKGETTIAATTKGETTTAGTTMTDTTTAATTKGETTTAGTTKGETTTAGTTKGDTTTAAITKGETTAGTTKGETTTAGTTKGETTTAATTKGETTTAATTKGETTTAGTTKGVTATVGTTKGETTTAATTKGETTTPATTKGVSTTTATTMAEATTARTTMADTSTGGTTTAGTTMGETMTARSMTVGTTVSDTTMTVGTTPSTAPPAGTSAPVGPRVTPTPTSRSPVTVTVSTVCPEAGAAAGERGHDAGDRDKPPVVLAMMAGEKARPDEDGGPMRGDMQPREDGAAGGPPPPPPGRAPLVSSGGHQTHNLSESLLHLASLSGALPAQWPPQPVHLTEDHIRLAGLLAASYSLGRAACDGAKPAPLPPQALPAWVMPPPPPPPAPMRPPMSAWAPGMGQMPVTAPPTAEEDTPEEEDESESSEEGREDGLLEDELIEDEVTEDPLMEEEEEGSGAAEDVDREEVEAVIAARSALRVPRLPRRRGGRTVGRAPASARRSESMVMPRMTGLRSGRPLARSAASARSSAVSRPAPVDRLTAMKLVEDIMERHRSALGELYSEQRQQLDEQLKQQRQAIQRTFSVELKYVADILTAIGSKPHEKPVQTPPGHQEDGDQEDYENSEVFDSQKPGEDTDGDESGEVDYEDTNAEEAGGSTNPPTVQASGSSDAVRDVAGPAPVRPARYPESHPVNWTVTPGPGGAAEGGTTPFARSPRTNYSDAVCQPFSEEAATTALMRDARVLMDALFGVGLELFQAVRPDEPAAARIALPMSRSASPRASQQMTRLVRAVAGSELRFQYPLDTLRELEAPLDRLQELLSAGVDSRPVPGGADYNLTMAVTALTTCFIDSVPGFRLEMNSDGRTALGELKRDAPRLQDRSTADGSVALRLSAALEHAWSLYRFMFNAFIGPASRVQLEADRNLRVISLRGGDLRAALAGAAAGLPGARRAELRRILTQLTADGSELQHAVSELRQLMTLMSDVSDLLLTSRPTGGSPRAIESGPSAVIRHVGDALLRGLGCMFSALDGSWLPLPLPDSPSLPAAPTDSEPPAVCENTEDTEQNILDDMPIFVEMLYKIGLKFTGAFTVEAASRQAAAVPRLDTAVSPASLQMERLVRVVAGSTGRFRHPLAAAEEYISLLDRLTALLATGAERANSTPPAASTGEGQDHNLTEAVELMIACFVEHVPGFELQRDSAARAALTAVGELETVVMQGRSTQLVPRGPSVAMRLSVVMVRTWTNWVTLLNRFLRPAASVQLHQSTSVRVLSVRARELRAALLGAVRALEPRRQQELREVCAALAAADPRLQPAVGELRHLMDYLADITDLLLTTGAAGPRQAIAAGPSAVIRHMGYALLHSLGCFSAALAGGWETPVHPWATPSPPTTPAPPPAPPAGDVPTPRCQVLEEANSDAVIVRDLEVLMKDFFDMGLTFFNLFKSDPVFAPTLFGADGAGSLLPDARTSAAAAAARAEEASARQGWLMGAVRGGAMRYQFPLEVLEQQLPALERLWTLIAAGAGGSPLGPADSEHNLTQAVTALTGCFAQHVPGYHLEEILDAKSTNPTAVGLPHLDPVKRRAGDSDSVTLRAADVTAATWRVWRPVLGAFVRPSSVVQLQPAKNVRVLSLNVDRLRARILASISALDVVQRAELSRVCRQLGSAELRFAVGELQQLLAPLAELAALRLTKAAPLARQQQTAAAGPAGIVVQMSRALPHSLGCFLAALAGDGDGGIGVPPEIPPPVTAAPGAIPIPIPGPQPVPSVPQPGAQPVPVFTAKPKPSASPKPPPVPSAIPKPPPTVAASEPTAAPVTPPPQAPTTTAAGGVTESPEHGDEEGHGDLFLTQQDVDVVEDILAGLG